jgi:transcriptional regulator GlxA family with amidase domain
MTLASHICQALGGGAAVGSSHAAAVSLHGTGLLYTAPATPHAANAGGLAAGADGVRCVVGRGSQSSA